MPKPSNINEIVKTINSIGGLMAKVDENGNLVIANERGGQVKASPQSPKEFKATDEAFKHAYPQGSARPAGAALGGESMGSYHDAVLSRLAQLQADKENLNAHIQAIMNNPPSEALQERMFALRRKQDDVEQEQLWAEDELYRSGYVPPAATDITSHMLQFGAGEQMGLVKPGGAQDD
jgi:hypothetical protein